MKKIRLRHGQRARIDAANVSAIKMLEVRTGYATISDSDRRDSFEEVGRGGIMHYYATECGLGSFLANRAYKELSEQIGANNMSYEIAAQRELSMARNNSPIRRRT